MEETTIKGLTAPALASARDIQDVTPGGGPEDLFNRYIFRSPVIQHDPRILQILPTFPQNLERDLGRSIDLVRFRRGSGQSPFSVFWGLEGVHDETSIGISDGRVEDVVLIV